MELPPLVPETSASANSATSANFGDARPTLRRATVTPGRWKSNTSMKCLEIKGVRNTLAHVWLRREHHFNVVLRDDCDRFIDGWITDPMAQVQTIKGFDCLKSRTTSEIFLETKSWWI